MDRYKPWDAVYDEQVEDNQLTGCIDAGLNLLKNMYVFMLYFRDLPCVTLT